MTAVAFSYGSLPPEVAADLHARARRIGRRLKRTSADMIETGNDLASARSAVNLATFGRWCESECGISTRLAQLFIRAAEVFGERREIISQTSPTNLMKLAAPSVPDEVRDRLVRRITNGERLRTSTISAEIRAARVVPEKPAAEWDTDREVSRAFAAARRKAAKPQRVRAEDDELLLADFYAAWSVVPEHLRIDALKAIEADAYMLRLLEQPA